MTAMFPFTGLPLLHSSLTIALLHASIGFRCLSVNPQEHPGLMHHALGLLEICAHPGVLPDPLGVLGDVLLHRDARLPAERTQLGGVRDRVTAVPEAELPGNDRLEVAVKCPQHHGGDLQECHRAAASDVEDGMTRPSMCDRQ